MSKKKETWHVELEFSDGETLESEYTFSSRREAFDEGYQMRSDYNAGSEILHMSNPGDYPSDWDDPEVLVWKD